MAFQRLAATGLLIYLLAATAYINLDNHDRLIDTWNSGEHDIKVFYQAGRVVTGAGRDDLYAEDGDYFNPPIFALAYAPLALLDYPEATRLNFAISIGAAALLALLTISRGAIRWEKAAIILALVSIMPLHDALTWGQPISVYALLGAVALFATERRPNAPAGWLASSLLILKPTLLLAPLVMFAVRRLWRPLLGIGAIAVLLFILPFAVVGLDQVKGLLWQSREVIRDAFVADARVTAPATAMFNWNGVVARIWREEPPLLPVLIADFVTLLLAYKAIREGTFREAWLAATAATLLVLPHVNLHDWLMLFAPAVAVYLERRSPVTLSVLLSLHVSLVVMQIFWSGGLVGGIWAPALFGLIVYLAFRREIEAWLERALKRLQGGRSPGVRLVVEGPG